ncbi:hypothetical protein BU15DRAFT_65575 [Melanogaster broomeanus]|nr:hypothetical protein BU15DRAFT_65575 [Melanogaster broomeanus]
MVQRPGFNSLPALGAGLASPSGVESQTKVQHFAVTWPTPHSRPVNYHPSMSSITTSETLGQGIYLGLCDAISPSLSNTTALEAFNISDDMSAEQETLFPASTTTVAGTKDANDLNTDFT